MSLTAPPSEGPRVAIWGFGTAARRAHLPALTEPGRAATVVGVGDPSPRQRALARELIPGVTVSTTLGRLLGASRADLLVIASPPSSHLPALTAASDHGIHAVCEKPLGLRGEDLAVLARLRQQRPDLALVTVHQYGWAPPWRELARAVRAATATQDEWRLTIRVDRPGSDPLSAGGWRNDTHDEGGILGDHAVHYLALCRELAPTARVVAAGHGGSAGRRAAQVLIDASPGRAAIDVSYECSQRHNTIRLEIPAHDLIIEWRDDQLATTRRGVTRRSTAGSLSDRRFIDALYSPFYDDVLAHLGDARWRERRADQTLGVARLLHAAVVATRGSLAAAS